MSLHHAAKHLESKGRRGDDMLVHMSKGEVQSLQALAKAHGGSLTINPDTGLAEAGFLSRILPMAAGAALMYAVPGMDPQTAGMIVGGGTAAATGSMNQGLSAGLGAYGGAGLGTGFGASAATPAATATAPVAPAAGAGTAGYSVESASMFPAGTTAGVNAGTQAAGSNLAGMDKFVGVDGMTAGAPTVTTGGLTTNSVGETLKGSASTLPGAGAAGQYSVSPATLTGERTVGQQLLQNVQAKPLAGLAAAASLSGAFEPKDRGQPKSTTGGQIMEYEYDPGYSNETKTATGPQRYKPLGYRQYAADGGLMDSYASGGPVEQMSNANAVGANTGFPQADMKSSAYATPWQSPVSQNVLQGAQDTRVDPYTGAEKFAGGGTTEELNPQYANMLPQDAKRLISKQGDETYAEGGSAGKHKAIMDAFNRDYGALRGAALGASAPFVDGQIGGAQQADNPSYEYNADAQEYKRMATGGISDAHYNLGGYSDGGRLLKGPGDGVSDSIPAVIGRKQPARLADGEFVVPARIVSEIGNGSTEAGARKLYAMMDRVQKARGKTVGKGKVAKNTRADKFLPA